jgi:hypothetical protein
MVVGALRLGQKKIGKTVAAATRWRALSVVAVPPRHALSPSIYGRI